MKAFRALLTIIVFLLIIVFLFQNTWMQEEHTVVYRLFAWEAMSIPVPIWGFLLLAFFVGYILAWLVGRLDIISHKNTVRKARKQVAELEKALDTERERNVQLSGDRDRAAAAAAAASNRPVEMQPQTPATLGSSVEGKEGATSDKDPNT